MQPFHNAYGVVAGPSSRSVSGVPGTSLAAIPQGFVAAAGVSLNGQASRTETLEFVFSLAELKRWRTEHDTARLCAISDNMDLRGRLGLKEWVTQALEPVRSNLLYAGYHPKPQSTPQGQSQKSSSPQPAPRNAVTSPLVPLLAVRKCTPGDVQNIKNALSDLNSADNALLDSSLVNVQESIESLSKNQSTSLDLANGDFSKAIDSLKTKAADSEQYIPVLDQFVLSKLNAVATFVKSAIRKQAILAKDTTDNIAFANERASNAARTAHPLEEQITTIRAELPVTAPTENDKCNRNDYDIIANNAANINSYATQAVKLANDARKDINYAATNIKLIQSFTSALTGYANSLTQSTHRYLRSDNQFNLC